MLSEGERKASTDATEQVLHMKKFHLQWVTWTLQLPLADCLLSVSVMILGYKH